MILFLNKTDIFADKIANRPIRTCFPEYEGPNTFSEASEFIRKKFESLNQKRSKDVYTHFTCATDSNNIKFVFDVVSDRFILENLKSCKLY
jgi:guanine nucleotide-binding protein G(i) subunit alpha